MKTLSDFKRLAQIGVTFTAFWPCKENITRTRQVTNRQTNAVIFGTEKSYFYFPKTDNLSFIDGVMVEYNDPAKVQMPPECRMPLLAYALGETFPESVKAILCEQYKAARQAELAEYDKRRAAIIAALQKDADELRAQGDTGGAEYLETRIGFINEQAAKLKAMQDARMAA